MKRGKLIRDEFTKHHKNASLPSLLRRLAMTIGVWRKRWATPSVFAFLSAFDHPLYLVQLHHRFNRCQRIYIQVIQRIAYFN